MSSVFKTADGALAFRGGFDSHALSPSSREDRLGRRLGERLTEHRIEREIEGT